MPVSSGYHMGSTFVITTEAGEVDMMDEVMGQLNGNALNVRLIQVGYFFYELFNCPTRQMEDDENDSDEADDYTIRKSDALVLVGHTEEDFSCLEVHVYEEKTCNLYGKVVTY